MKLWFGTTTSRFEEYISYYIKIRNYLIKTNNTLLFDWLDDAWSDRQKNPGRKRDIRGIFEKIIDAINNAEASVIEFTVPNFSSSHQIYYSISKGKPTLVLRLKKDNTWADSYIDALASPFLVVKEYNLDTYEDIIDEFIGYSKLDPANGRYNIVLSKKHKFYLDWASVRYHRSRSEIIRSLIENTIEQDRVFKNQLKSSSKNDLVSSKP